MIEAPWLFDVAPEDIEVLVHPQSIVHALIRYRDESVIAVLALPDMTIPIATRSRGPTCSSSRIFRASTWPPTGTLTFARPDLERFPCLALAWRALAAGGAMPAVLNAANEVAVSRFLADEIAFPEIAATVAACMNAFEPSPCNSLEELMAADSWARRTAADWRAASEAS